MLYVGRLSLLLLGLALGCAGDETGLISVAGTLLLDDQPLPRGSVTLEPESSANPWDRPVGMVGADGRFEVFTNGQPGVPPGTYRVIVFATAAVANDVRSAHPGLPQSLIPARYQRGETTPLRLVVDREPVFQTLKVESQ